MNSEIDLQFKERAQRYLFGQLNQSEVDELWAEALEDGKKLNYLKTIANISAINNDDDSLHSRDNKDTNVHLLHSKHYAAAAVISVLIGVIAFISLPFSNNSPTNEQINPLESVSIDYYRSSNNVNMLDEVVSEAVVKYNNDNIEQAIALLNEHISDSNYDAESKFVLKTQLGKIYYNVGRYDKAKTVFNEIVASSENFNTKEKALWLLANSYLQSSKVDSKNAVEALKKIKVMKGAHSRMADTMLKNIE